MQAHPTESLDQLRDRLAHALVYLEETKRMLLGALRRVDELKAKDV